MLLIKFDGMLPNLKGIIVDFKKVQKLFTNLNLIMRNLAPKVHLSQGIQLEKIYISVGLRGWGITTIS